MRYKFNLLYSLQSQKCQMCYIIPYGENVEMDEVDVCTECRRISSMFELLMSSAVTG